MKKRAIFLAIVLLASVLTGCTGGREADLSMDPPMNRFDYEAAVKGYVFELIDKLMFLGQTQIHLEDPGHTLNLSEIEIYAKRTLEDTDRIIGRLTRMQPPGEMEESHREVLGTVIKVEGNIEAIKITAQKEDIDSLRRLVERGIALSHEMASYTSR